VNLFKVFVGITLVVIGFSILALGSLAGAAQYGALVMIGPVPIILSSSPELAAFLLIFALIILILPILFTRW